MMVVSVFSQNYKILSRPEKKTKMIMQFFPSINLKRKSTKRTNKKKKERKKEIKWWLEKHSRCFILTLLF
jgi:hypothetical protein